MNLRTIRKETRKLIHDRLHEAIAEAAQEVADYVVAGSSIEFSGIWVKRDGSVYLGVDREGMEFSFKIPWQKFEQSLQCQDDDSLRTIQKALKKTCELIDKELRNPSQYRAAHIEEIEALDAAKNENLTP